MKKSRKKYNKPKMLVERFVPQEYIGACDWAIGDELFLECSNDKVLVTQVTNKMPSYSSLGQIAVDSNTGDLTVSGYINNEKHNSSTYNGEYTSVFYAPGHTVGEVFIGLTLCNHHVSGAHHHISHYNKKNPS